MGISEPGVRPKYLKKSFMPSLKLLKTQLFKANKLIYQEILHHFILA